MREILFRGKRLDNGEWVESHGISRGRPDEKSGYRYYLGIGGGAIVGTNEAGNIVRLEAKEDCLYCEVDPATVGQCTGLKDRNGMRIFEGDIMRGCAGDMVVFYGEIIGEGYGFQWKSASGGGTESMTGFIDEYEVIGNIHDNQKLLEAAT